MIKILTSSQVREADQYTIIHEQIPSIDLMERASEAFVDNFIVLYPANMPVKIFCGTGNNGGDGLAIGRLLIDRDVSIYVIGDPEQGSMDFKVNLIRLASYSRVRSKEDFPICHEKEIIIDGIFGSGLSRSVEGLAAELIDFLNQQNSRRVSIDIASGLFSDHYLSKGSVAFKPHFTFCFQIPKLSFFLPGCYPYVGEWKMLDIGLDQSFINGQKTDYYLTEKKDVVSLIPRRSKFTHKHQVGKLLIVAGSKGKMGAAVLCASAAFRAGASLVNVCVPKCGTQILQICIPEVMIVENEGGDTIHSIPAIRDVMAIGPGLGTSPETISAFEKYLHSTLQPLVIDADAINILSERKKLLELVPKESIFTPHPGEFKKLVGGWSDDFEKLEKLRLFCVHYTQNVVLKGAYSAVCDSSGNIFFNPTGNPALATAGSGDVLTGIIVAFLAQGLKSFDALKLGVYVHGLAGDKALKALGSPGIQASDIVSFIPKAVHFLS